MNKQASLGAVMTSVNHANGLPNAHYIDPVVFAEERQSVLFANWSGVGFGKDIPEAGDAKPVEFLGVPLLLVRDERCGRGSVHRCHAMVSSALRHPTVPAHFMYRTG